MSYENQRRPRQGEAAGSIDGDNTSVALATDTSVEILADSDRSQVRWIYTDAEDVLEVTAGGRFWRFRFATGDPNGRVR